MGKIIEAASADITDLESEQSKETRKELASAFCAVAELYMTDLCDNPEAEHECSESVRKAIEADAKSPEVCPLLYTTRLSTSRMLIELEEGEKSVQVLDGL